jgi:dynein heavy chain
MKKLLKHAGCSGKQTVFLFADSQIKEENFVEDINLLLNTGDIPNLFPGDEKAQILEKVQGSNKELGKKMETDALTLFTYFVERVKANLHIVLAMSPVGDAFRNRLRMFPSLINCCTIDWYVQSI